MSARVIPDLKPNEDYKLECEEIFKIIQQWALCGLDFVFSWNWYSHRPWEGEDTALWTLHRAFLCIVHLLLVYRVTCLKLCQHAADLFTSETILSAYPHHPSSRDSGMQKTPGGPDYQDPEHPDIGSISAINQARASWRPHASTDTGQGAHYRATRTRYRGIIVLFVFPVCYLLSV